MALNKKNVVRNVFFSMRLRIICLILALSFTIYFIFNLVSTHNDKISLILAQQYYSNELKLLIADQYLDSQVQISTTEQEELAHRFEILGSKGSVYNHIITQSNPIITRELEKLMTFVEKANIEKGNTEELQKIYVDSLEYPSRIIYEETQQSIIQIIDRLPLNKQIVSIILLFIFLITFLILNSIAVKIGLITSMTRNLVNQDDTLELTERLNFKANTEMADIVQNMNDFMGKLEEYTIRLINYEQGMDYQVTKIFDSSRSWNLEIQVMSNSTSRISRQIIYQITSVNQASAALEEMERTLDITFNNISRQAAAMTQSAATLEEMGRQVEGVAKISSETAELAKKLTEVANKGNQAVDASIVSIRDVAEYSSQILKLLQLITGIAKQTNLLAMNASIEAAHAGEAGRGFAIVAEEIRRLSETTNKNAKEIRTVVDTMVEKIDNSVSQVQVAGEDLSHITNYVGNVEERIAQLNTMMQEQNTATHEMITTIEGLVNLSQEINLSMEEQQHGIHEYSKTILELKDNIGEVKTTLDGHMSSVNNFLTILQNLGIRIEIQKNVMNDVKQHFVMYHLTPERLEPIETVQQKFDQLFLEKLEELKTKKDPLT